MLVDDIHQLKSFVIKINYLLSCPNTTEFIKNLVLLSASVEKLDKKFEFSIGCPTLPSKLFYP